jgi:hypothetical protein
MSHEPSTLVRRGTSFSSVFCGALSSFSLSSTATLKQLLDHYFFLTFNGFAVEWILFAAGLTYITHISNMSDEPSAKRRKVRKGTHSCWECRRRKAKCVFASPDDTVCTPCARRHTRCVGQETLEDSVAAPTRSISLIRNEENTFAVPPSSQSQSTRVEHTPFGIPSPPASVSCHPQSSKYRNITQALLRALPCQSDIDILLTKAARVSLACYESCYYAHNLLAEEMPRKHISFANLLHSEAHPLLLAKPMLQLAAALQHIPSSKVLPGLSEDHSVIRERIADTAIQMVTVNDTLIGTLEGLENIILEGMYHVDGGNIRRAWITMRRAVLVGQLLGLHRCSDHHRYKIISDTSRLMPDAMFGCTVTMERVLSLLLGLPTSSRAIGSVISAKHDQSKAGANIFTLLMDTTAKILDRNEISDVQDARKLTDSIDRELVNTAKLLPSTFWEPPSFANIRDVDSEAGIRESQRTWDQLCYHNLVNQLHLPYILCPDPKALPHTVYSRMACVNSSREILTRANAIRLFNPYSVCCKMGEFMALIAGMTLVLNHIVSHCHRQTDINLLVHQRSGDRALVESALRGMSTISEAHEDLHAAKCAALLTHLLAVEADAATGQKYTMRKLPLANEARYSGQNVLVVKVPYVGAICIAPSSGVSRGVIAATPRDLQEDITVGGIGYVQITADGYHENGLPTPQTTGHTPTVSGPSPMEPLVDVTANIFTQQDQMFPDAAAGMDDWVFQGTDTAFFDALFRGFDDQQLNTGIEPFDFDTLPDTGEAQSSRPSPLGYF